LLSLAAGSDWLDINYYGLNHKFFGTAAEKARFTSTGNLLIGTTTDITGSGGLKVAGTTTSTNTTSGALVVTGGVGVGGAMNVGGAATFAGAVSVGTTLTSTGSIFGLTTAASQIDIGSDTRSTDIALRLNTAAGSARDIWAYTAGVLRWRYGVSSTAESGANAGSNWSIQAFSDAGASLGVPLSIARSTLAATFAGAVVTGSTTLSGAGAIPITTSLVKFTSTAAANALTLANGVDGQRLTIVHDVKGTLGTGVITPTTKTGFSTITLTNAGDTVSLVYVTTRGWMVTGSYLATIVP
jgi:hypothetical protein